MSFLSYCCLLIRDLSHTYLLVSRAHMSCLHFLYVQSVHVFCQDVISYNLDMTVDPLLLRYYCEYTIVRYYSEA